MLLLLVDECYAFDYLSILEIKKNKNSSNHAAWLECKSNLETQIPIKIEELLSSSEYKDLYNANLKTFDAVDKARSGGVISAKDVDDCNMLRYNCKVALQNKFFANSEMREKKL